MYKIGDVARGIVTGIESYGIFLSFEEDVVGLIHISEISEYFVKNPEDYAKIGDKIEAEVIEVDEDKKQIKLSLKRLNKNRKKKIGIKETKSGFETLGKKLDEWIEEKMH